MTTAVPSLRQSGLTSRSSARAELASWRPSARLDAVETYGRFEILGRIGRGGMAEILLARERSLVGGSRHLVIKRVLPEVREFDEMLHMFLEESRVVMGLSHPNLCQIYEVGEQEGAWFIAMEWVNGVTLNQLSRRAVEGHDVDCAVIARVIAQCAEALHHAHTARDANGELMKLVHRDVSPHNIMVAYDGRVKLLDFGIAKSAGATHHTEAGVVKGKICYMAPEQWLKQPLDARTDVFALGVCLYEALSGRMLFKRDTQTLVMKAVLAGDVTPLAEVAPEVPPALAAIAHRALATKPEHRFESAKEMAEALERCLTALAEPVSSARIAEYTRRLFRAEVKLGPVLERSARAAELASELVLPPLPPALLSMAAPPRRRSLPPPFGVTPVLSLPTPADPVWSDLSEFDLSRPELDETERLECEEVSTAAEAPRASDHETAPFRDETSSATVPSVRPLEPEQPARPLARTLSMHVGPRLRRAAVAAALLAAIVPFAWSLRSAPEPVAMPMSASEREPVRPAAFPTPAFTLLPSAPLTEAPTHEERSQRVQPRDPGTLSINTRPWSTVYLGSRLLGSTPLANVAVPRGALMLKLVDRDGRVHLRRIAPSKGKTRTAHFDF